MNSIKDAHASVLLDLVTNLERKFPYASALVVQSRALNVSCSIKEEAVRESGPSVGAVFSVWNGESLWEAATGDLSDDGLKAATEKLMSWSIPNPVRPVRVVKGSAGDLSYRTPMEVDPATISLEEKLDLCRKGRDRASGLHPAVLDAHCTYVEEYANSLFVDAGSTMYQEIVRVAHGFNDVFGDGGEVRHDGEFNMGAGGYEIAVLPDSDWEAVKARIPHLLRATPIEPGLYDLVLCPGAAGLVAHEAFGHGVETDMFLKGRAKAKEYVGKMVGSPLVNLYDDPTYVGASGTYGFDDQGQVATKTQIVRDGVFVNGLTDLYSSMHLGIPRTANGRRQGVNKAYPRMTNTYFGRGEHKLEEMVEATERGVYLGSGGSGMEDPKDWGIQCIFGWAQGIEDGRLTDKYHTHVGLTGYVPDLLASVSMVGSDFRLLSGGCGKGHKEFVRVGMGGPHLKMKGRLG